MSARSDANATSVSNDLGLIAPKFRAAVERAIAACNSAGLEAKVFEAYRSDALQRIYYARGRTVIPPNHTVTNAPNNQFSRPRGRRRTQDKILETAARRGLVQGGRRDLQAA